MNDLDFSQGHRVTGSWNLCNHFVLKWRGVTQTFAMVDYVREMTSKKSCKCGKYGSSEHLLFLYVFSWFKYNWLDPVLCHSLNCSQVFSWYLDDLGHAKEKVFIHRVLLLSSFEKCLLRLCNFLIWKSRLWSFMLTVFMFIQYFDFFLLLLLCLLLMLYYFLCLSVIQHKSLIICRKWIFYVCR